MAHMQTQTCICGHGDTAHSASRPHACRVRGCDCPAFLNVKDAEDV